LDIDRYGGYIEEKEAFITLKDGKLFSVKRTEQNDCKGCLKILRNQIFMQETGIYRTVASLKESAKWCQLVLDAHHVKYIYLLKRYNSLTQKEKSFVENNRQLFDQIKSAIFSFIEKNELASLKE